LDVVDAPTQRLYAVLVFVILQAWKFYDIASLYAAEGDSITELGFCLKWLLLDGCFFWFLPLLRIPWLTFTPTFTLCAISSLSVLDIFLSLKYQIPITAIAGGLWKRE
jgi:nucleoporin POM152